MCRRISYNLSNIRLLKNIGRNSVSHNHIKSQRLVLSDHWRLIFEFHVKLASNKHTPYFLSPSTDGI